MKPSNKRASVARPIEPKATPDEGLILVRAAADYDLDYITASFLVAADNLYNITGLLRDMVLPVWGEGGSLAEPAVKAAADRWCAHCGLTAEVVGAWLPWTLTIWRTAPGMASFRRPYWPQQLVLCSKYRSLSSERAVPFTFTYELPSGPYGAYREMFRPTKREPELSELLDRVGRLPDVELDRVALAPAGWDIGNWSREAFEDDVRAQFEAELKRYCDQQLAANTGPVLGEAVDADAPQNPPSERFRWAAQYQCGRLKWQQISDDYKSRTGVERDSSGIGTITRQAVLGPMRLLNTPRGRLSLYSPEPGELPPFQ